MIALETAFIIMNNLRCDVQPQLSKPTRLSTFKATASKAAQLSRQHNYLDVAG